MNVDLVVVVLGVALFAITEILPFTPWKANGIVHSVVEMAKGIYDKLKKPKA